MKLWQIVLALWPFGLLLVWSLMVAAKRGDAAAAVLCGGPRRTDGRMWSRIDRAMRLEDAARLYRFISGHATGADHRVTSARELEGLVCGRTFDEFCERNGIVPYEAVIR